MKTLVLTQQILINIFSTQHTESINGQKTRLAGEDKSGRTDWCCYDPAENKNIWIRNIQHKDTAGLQNSFFMIYVGFNVIPDS